ncbi:Acyl-CoA synthetase (AMP-forming)/AMP-acid ligase II [Variovorax sp. HW608]|uniref:class I adenylate-forming enzyme family protein n=1 Tax=Variovorax sp. HW608 TaxID=1034889 RepID=UPI00081F84D4|nr:class I adenylate-forming enzyme family protein [Variovorax sp. HW608]SCK10042.1 Acyl-CoA synthetase (AMP-forming)/AMP-acid ligase II [Variovorax sp. HW608]
MDMMFDTERLYGRRAERRWDRVCVGDITERMTWSRPDEVAFIGWEGAYSAPQFASLTWRQADQLANRVANMLREHGLQRGDRLMMACENSVEAYVTKLGAAKIGVVPAALNPAFAVDVVRYLVERLKPSFVIADASTRPEVVRALSDGGAPVNVTICIEGEVIPGSADFAEEVERHSGEEPVATVHGDDIWELLFTSGTTSMPKAVMLSHTYAYLASHGMALTFTRGVEIESRVCLVSFLPIIYHIGDQILSMPALVAGGKLVIGRRANAKAVADAVVKHGATAVWGGAPQSIKQISYALEALAPRDKTLSVMVYGWGAVEPEVLRRLEAWSRPGFQLAGIFGQTEAIACHRFWPSSQRELFEAAGSARNYVGVPSPLLASTIIGDAGSDLLSAGRSNEAGEAVYRSPVMMAGYYRDQDATARAFEGGWFHSGDSCLATEDGTRVMIDRYKDIIKSGGENVSSMRVEARLHAHPGVLKAAVVGLAHVHWDEAVTAFVVRAKPEVEEHELLDWARAGLAGFETPKKIVFVDALPETVGGKVMKHRLRAAWASLYRDAGSATGAPAL